MAIVVKHKVTLQRFIFLGVGYGMYKATRPGFIGGNLFPDEEEGEARIAAVCDKDGNIHWISPNKLKVIEVDGVKLEDLGSTFEDEKKDVKKADMLEVCPGCGKRVSIYEKSCPNCGLTLLDSEYEKIAELAKRKKNL
ncbi:hypothetical protein [Wukongibacter sp. M2B1]|uniref:hypothetical protein n=1 Tax=Wukongibacter sp. M2B1 TaxID=3088895 RepID=UPI003D7C0F5F